MATSLTQADLDKLEKAFARGVLTVSYAGQTVTFANGAEMLQRIAYVKAALAAAADRPAPSTFASFERC